MNERIYFIVCQIQLDQINAQIKKDREELFDIEIHFDWFY